MQFALGNQYQHALPYLGSLRGEIHLIVQPGSLKIGSTSQIGGNLLPHLCSIADISNPS